MAFIHFQVNDAVQRFKPRSEQEAAKALYTIACSARDLAWRLAPLNHQAIIAIVQPAKSLSEAVTHLRSVKPKALEEHLLAACGEVIITKHFQELRVKPIKFAWALYVRNLLSHMLPFACTVSGAIPQRIMFAANAFNYRIVRKTNERSEAKEMLACLANIASSALRKSVELAPKEGLKTLQATTTPRTRSLAALAAALESLGFEEVPRAHKDVVRRIVHDYALSSTCEACGYPLAITPELVCGLWPEFKMPGMRGRRPKA